MSLVLLELVMMCIHIIVSNFLNLGTKLNNQYLKMTVNVSEFPPKKYGDLTHPISFIFNKNYEKWSINVMF